MALTLAACGSAATPAPSGPASPAASPPSSSLPTAGPASAGPTPAGPVSTAKVAIDQGLLRYLPAAIGSIAVSFSSEAAQDVVGDPTLVKNASSLAYGIAVDSTSNDLVVAAVVQLRDGVYSDEFFRSWRGSYDTAACAQAGGVGGNAEAEISGRTVYIGTCNGGAHTYHVYLDTANVIVSATSVGAKRFGEQLIDGLRA